MAGLGWMQAQGHGDDEKDHFQLGLLAVQEGSPSGGGHDPLEPHSGRDSTSDESGQSDSGGSDSTATTSSSEDERGAEHFMARVTNPNEDEPLGAAGWAALLALALIALAGPVAAYLCHTRPCYKSGYIQQGPGRAYGGRSHWSHDWPLYVVSAPMTLTFAGWCVFVHRRARREVPLHRWTLRCGVLSFTYAAGMFLLPTRDVGCHGQSGAAWRAAFLTVLFLSWMGCVLIPCFLLGLKLRGLGCFRIARVVGAAILVSVCGGAAWLSGVTTRGFLLAIGQGTAPLDAAIDKLLKVGALVYFINPVVVACLGAWGLLASATRAVRSRRQVSVQMARWMLLAAVLVLASGLLMCMEVASFYQEAMTPESWLFKFAYTSVHAANNIVSCLSVAILSGLSGSKSQRRMAVRAFETINSYRDYELQAYYEEFLAYLDDAKVKWIRVRYLFELAASGKAMVRCQDVPLGEVFVGSEGFPRFRENCKHRFVLSHPWLRPEHPDREDGLKLDRLVEQLLFLDAEDDDAVFIDFMSLPQHDKLHPDFLSLLHQHEQSPGFQHPALRTREEDKLFKKALDQMEMLYSMGSTPVIVLPMNDVTAKGAEYLSRGWCFFEFALAFNFDNIAIAKGGSYTLRTQVLRDYMIDRRCYSLEGFMREFEKTHFTDKGDSELVRDLFHHTLNRPLPDSVVGRPTSGSPFGFDFQHYCGHRRGRSLCSGDASR